MCTANNSSQMMRTGNNLPQKSNNSPQTEEKINIGQFTTAIHCKAIHRKNLTINRIYLNPETVKIRAIHRKRSALQTINRKNQKIIANSSPQEKKKYDNSPLQLIDRKFSTKYSPEFFNQDNSPQDKLN
jgi:hypothetical protein